MKKAFIIGIAVLIVLTAGNLWAANAKKENAAVIAAKNWLSLTDTGKYSESWREAAQYLKNAVPEVQWEQMLQSHRAPLGKVISRKLKNKTYRTSLPGSPDGQYVVIQFKTSFQNKKSAIETITLMFDKDAKWRVSGYYIK